MRHLLLKIFITIFLFMAIMTAMVPRALAEVPGETVGSIRVSGLGNYAGQFITAIYANGRNNLLFASEFSSIAPDIFISAIRLQKTLPIPQGSDSVTFPATPKIPWSGLKIPYNYVVFVIHPQDGGQGSKFRWTNNSSKPPPEGVQSGENTALTRINLFSKKEIDRLSSILDAESVLQFQFN